jgi:hypothetical protein
MNPDRAQQRADELAARLKRRMAELDKEEQLRALPPVVVGAALVVELRPPPSESGPPGR